MRGVPISFLATVLLVVATSACDRNLEPYDPDEQPRRPDLSKIFPPGAERAARDEVGPPSMPAPPGAAGGRGAPPLASDAAPIAGTIRLAESLEGRVPGNAVLFLIARPGASGPPLAVKRIASPRFPLDFEIGPDDRMIQAMPFTGPLRLVARVDADGNATTREPGDLQGAAEGRHEPGARGVELIIDERL